MPPETGSNFTSHETLAAEGRYALYKRAAEGTAQRIFVSPEVAGSLDFRKKVLSQPRLQEHLRMVTRRTASVSGVKLLLRIWGARRASWTRSADDSSAIGFYHAKNGMVRKRELETMLRDGHIRILCCTDAVGMGRYMCNIESVILWKLPPSFGALAQRSGRAAQDFERLVEAILFVPAKLLKDGVAEEEARLARVEQFSSQGGARAEEGNEAEKAEAETAAAAAAKSKKKRKAARISFADALEAKFLSSRIIWDEYFQNATKASLDFVLPEGAQYCDVCGPASFNHWGRGSHEMQEVAVST
ncbi:hypothetical protein B0H13DRAFT_1869851 [Mycena leptocephala]|nr:hypothetical protein B0H13DRAFT_1869851 [Mycena leptocephala]